MTGRDAKSATKELQAKIPSLAQRVRFAHLAPGDNQNAELKLDARRNR